MNTIITIPKQKSFINCLLQASQTKGFYLHELLMVTLFTHITS